MADSSANPPEKKRTRRATTLHQFTSRRPTGYRYPLEFDQVTKQPVGDFATKFKSYVAVLARSKANITAKAWEKVDGNVKDCIWDDILQTFDIPNDEKLKKYWMSYAGERWTQFKSNLTREYVYGPGDKAGNTTPFSKYPFITAETWALFVESRKEEEFQDELAEKATQGSFHPQGRQDVLTVAIGKPDHFGRVKGAGRGVGLAKYFGPASHSSSSTNSQKLIAIKEELGKQLRDEFEEKCEVMKQKLWQDFRNEFGSHSSPPKDHISLKNTIGSKASCSPSHVEVPLKHDWLRELHIASYDMAEQIKLDLDHEPQPHFYIGCKEIEDMIKGNDLEMSHLGIWCTYFHRECIAREISDVYEFLDPYKVSTSGHKKEAIQTYIQNKLIEQNKKCFLAPYLNGKHWQLFVICPTVNTVVWMCSLHDSPRKALVEIVEKALIGYNMMKGLRKPRIQWVTPTVAKQNDGKSCGYYVMINMRTIVSATITDNWKKVFNASDPFTSEDLKHIREVWAEFFIRLYEERQPVGKEERRKRIKQ